MNQLSLFDYLEDVREIPLSHGMVAIVDASDFDWLNQWKWTCNAQGYAIRKYTVSPGKRLLICMHRLIISAPPDMHVDHIDRNPLNNIRSNLRLATKSQNAANVPKVHVGTSKYKGVSLQGTGKKWIATISDNNRNQYLGSYQTEIEAAIAYDRAALQIFGEYAWLNFEEDHR